ncbi:MAG: 6-phosphofructokinase [Sedimentisphaerales bacterium]|nr:6-phosphofructokinase [Sedimentisphaerales bacterium]
MRAFLCHSSQDSDFVVEVGKYLQRHLDRGVFFYEEYRAGQKDYIKTINIELDQCDWMVIFSGPELSEWQQREVNNAIALKKIGFIICKFGEIKLPPELNLVQTAHRFQIPDKNRAEARKASAEILKHLGITSRDDGLPINPHIFQYEKHIIDHFSECLCHDQEQLPFKLRKKQLEGCPVNWPKVVFWGDDRVSRGPTTAIDSQDFGEWRPHIRSVVAAALSEYHQAHCEVSSSKCMMKQGFVFPEAGPRDAQYFPKDNSGLRVAIMVSGGIAPGINSVIDGIVQRHELYAERQGYGEVLKITGLKNGFMAFDDWDSSAELISGVTTSERAGDGGSILGTSRVHELLESKSRRSHIDGIVRQLHDHHIDILYIIGGDGSMKAAHALWNVAEEHHRAGKRQISIVAVPKTMDNDILWIWQSFGFLSAVEKAREIIEHLSTEAESNPRLGVVQLFGSDSGFVVSHAVLASRAGHCDAALIPEAEFSMKKLANHLRLRMRRRNYEPIPRGLVVMAETAIPTDAMDYVRNGGIEIGLSKDEKKQIEQFCLLRDAHKRIQGQTDDLLRSAGLKIVSKGLHRLLHSTKVDHGDPSWEKLRVFTNEPRHLLRAIPPSCTDIIFGNRLGTLAVDNAIAGYTDFMISHWLTEYVLVPLELVVLGRKRIPKSGIFWKSVIAKTGQPPEFV